MSPDNHQLYIVNGAPDPGTVEVINLQTEAKTTIAVGDSPYSIGITPDGKHVYVSNNSGNTISIINTGTNTVEKTITSGLLDGPDGISFTPDGKKAYVNSLSTNTVLVIDTKTQSVVKSIPVGNYPENGSVITPDGRFVYIGNVNSQSLSVIDTATDTTVHAIQLVGVSSPQGLAFSPDGKRLYVTDSYAGILIIDTDPASSNYNKQIAHLALPAGDFELQYIYPGFIA